MAIKAKKRARKDRPEMFMRREFAVALGRGEQGWRRITGQGWREKDPEGYGKCLDVIRMGLTNQNMLAEMFGVKSETIHAVMMREFSEEELVEIGKKVARVGELVVAGKTVEVAREASNGGKDLAGLAMSLKALHDVAQSLNDKPAVVVEQRKRVTVEDVERMRREAMRDARVVEVEAVGVVYNGDVSEERATTTNELRSDEQDEQADQDQD